MSFSAVMVLGLPGRRPACAFKFQFKLFWSVLRCQCQAWLRATLSAPIL